MTSLILVSIDIQPHDKGKIVSSHAEESNPYKVNKEIDHLEKSKLVSEGSLIIVLNVEFS